MIPIGLEHLCVLGGSYLLALAGRIAFDPRHRTRWGSAAFWSLLGAALVGGERVPAEAVGWAVVAMTILAAT